MHSEKNHPHYTAVICALSSHKSQYVILCYMMLPTSSFVAVNRINVEYLPRRDLLGKLLGKPPAPHSVLRNLSLRLKAGDQVTMFGPAASGKSTLLRVLSGILTPSSGTVLINGAPPLKSSHLAAGYVSAEESEPLHETVQAILHAFGTTHGLTNLPARIGELVEVLGLQAQLATPASALSTTERLRLNLARAALSDSPLILLDDIADLLGAKTVQELLLTIFAGRTTIIATRQVAVAEALELPLFILHQAQIAHSGTCDEIADVVACQRTLDVWVEGLRYDLLRKLRQHAGVLDVRLLASSRFAGQKVRITVQSGRYLPSLYDIISQAPLVRVQEVPASLHDILSRLER